MSVTAVAKKKVLVTRMARDRKLATSYSGKENVMYVKGDSDAIKKFITHCSFSGLGAKTLGFKLAANAN